MNNILLTVASILFCVWLVLTLIDLHYRKLYKKKMKFINSNINNKALYLELLHLNSKYPKDVYFDIEVLTTPGYQNKQFNLKNIDNTQFGMVYFVDPKAKKKYKDCFVNLKNITDFEVDENENLILNTREGAWILDKYGFTPSIELIENTAGCL